VAVFFPVYDDEETVREVAMKSLAVLSDVASKYKVIIVDDGSPDRSGEIADELAAEYPEIISIHHEKNLGYGSALKSGFKESLDFDWICFTDGDNEYDLNDLRHMAKLFHRYDMIVTFRYVKIYGTVRIFISYVFNILIRWLFKSPFRDHSCGFKAVRSRVMKDMPLHSDSPFIGPEIIIKAMVRGYLIGEMGIRTYPRFFGVSHSTSIKNIIATIRDMFAVYRELFGRRKSESVSKA